ncbi:hypothetical protein [Psychrobacillus sp. OK032]|uniref:hypothetical protein n=1 Tax=Psychrobacillus sp. OK032 TaxID=1884358 RepID=UPI0008B31C8B|nr:hypothetical protein [Psychrobacillus sp. OK032]SER88044.1 hypothetical protein SAMN05518872_102472 [Psychrobacillus sp. OK032]
MEILSQSTDWFGHIFLLTIVIAMSIAFLVAFIGGVMTIFEKGFRLSDVIMTLLAGAISLLMALAATGGIMVGPTTTYKAVVTDYNAVIDAGYEIVSTDGKIVTLTKE